MSLRTKNKKWRYLFFIVLIITNISLIIISLDFNILQTIAVLIFMATWLFSVVYMIATGREFLQRLDMISRETVAFHHVPENFIHKAEVTTPSSSTLADKFIGDLYKWHDEVESPDMKNHITQMIEIAGLVSKRGNTESERFFMRYDETINKLLHKYDEIENTKLQHNEILDAMKKIESGLEQVVIAFRNEVASMYKNDLLDINAETTAFLQDLKNRGLLETNNNHSSIQS